MKKSVLICLLLLVYGPAFGASSRILPVSYNESTYGDATREYTSLATWEADTDNNLVAAANGEVLTCYDDDDAPYNDSVLVSGAVTSEDYFRVIRAAPGHRGTPTSGVRFESSFTTGNTITINAEENYFSAQDIASKATAVGNYAAFGFRSAGNYTKVAGCTAYDITGSGTGYAVGILIGGPIYGYVINCFVTNVTGGSYSDIHAGVRSSVSDGEGRLYVYNTTVTNCTYYGIEALANSPGISVLYVYNCISQGNGTAIDKVGTGTKTIYQTTNATSGVTFADDGYHLAPTDTVAIDNGTDLTNDQWFSFHDDIDGQTRDDWDIGCDEYIAESAWKPIVIIY